MIFKNIDRTNIMCEDIYPQTYNAPIELSRNNTRHETNRTKYRHAGSDSCSDGAEAGIEIK